MSECSNKSRYKMTLYISPVTEDVVDCSDSPLQVESEGNDVSVLKEGIDELIVNTVLDSKRDSGKYFVEMMITSHEEYYDSDECEVYVDLSQKKVVYGEI